MTVQVKGDHAVALRQMLHLGGKVRTTAEGSMDQHDRRVAASQIFVSDVQPSCKRGPRR
jgi:hypothetical protein